MGVSKPLQDGEVTFSKLADAAVTGTKLADAAVTGAKMSGAQSGAAPAYACRAWVNFNGTGTVSIRASGNVSSITDNGVGDYTVNFTTAMPDQDYCVVPSMQFDTLGTGSGNSTACIYRGANSLTAGACRINTIQTSAGTALDPIIVTASIFR